MDYYQTQSFFKEMFKGQKVSFEFDDKCIRKLELIYSEGKMHIDNHIEYQKVKVTTENFTPFYVPIQPHRMIAPVSFVKDKVHEDEIYFHQEHKDAYAKASDEEKAMKLTELSALTGMSAEQIKKQLE